MENRFLTDTGNYLKEGFNSMKELPKNSVTAIERTGDAAGDLVDSAIVGVTEGINPISDYEKSTAQRVAANELYKDNPQLEDGVAVKDVLNNKDDYTPQQYQEALNVYGGYVAGELGVDPSTIHIYAQNDGNAGMSDRDSPNAYVNAEHTNVTDTEDLIGTTAHELGHQRGEDEKGADRSSTHAVRAWGSESEYNDETPNVGTPESHDSWKQKNKNSPIIAKGNQSAGAVKNADNLPYSKVIENSETKSSFGSRPHPITGEIMKHNGVDYTAESSNQKINAAGDGVINENRHQYNPETKKGWGNTIVIKHSKDGNPVSKTRYAHLKEKPNLKVGDKVKEGDIVGEIGSTGGVTGPHVHVEYSEYNSNSKEWIRKDPANINPGKYKTRSEIPDDIKDYTQ